jgi:hypothetical protein
MVTPTELYPLLERPLQSSRLINHATARTAVARLVQIGLGLGPSAADAPAAVREAMHGWATTDRLS